MESKSITGFESPEMIEEIVRAGASNGAIDLPIGSLLLVIDRYLLEQISSGDLARIAEALDVNEFVVMCMEHQDRMKDALFKLSTPEINGLLTPERAKLIRAELNRANE